MLPPSSVNPLSNKLQIHLFGPPQVQWDGRLLPVPRRNVRGLLYYLAVREKPVSRAQLCLLFWPDLPEADSRRNLTRLLTHLRMALPQPEALVVSEDCVTLDEQRFWCDALEFRHLAGGEKSEQVLQRCAELYAGQFLAGFYLPDCPEYDAWLSQDQSDFEAQYLAVLSGLIERKTAGQDYAGAVVYAQHYLEIDCLAEEVHRRLITLYALVGDRSRALRQYEQCIAVLENELGARPEPETQAVYHSVLDGKLLDYREEGKKGFQPPWLSQLRLDIPLVGRSEVLSDLEKTFANVKAGNSSIVLISGEPGIGKTRLLHSFITKCQHQALVLYGSGDRGESSLPYHPIVEALHSSSFTCPASLAPVWVSEVSRLLPEINSLHPGLPPPVSLRGDEARIRLFEALCQFITALQADYGPVLLCLDNLHWFDQTSISWLIHFCRHYLIKTRQVMLVGTYRSEDAPRLGELYGSLSRIGLLDEIRLEGLDLGNIIELLNYILTDGPVKEALAYRLRRATGGNPFFILETLRILVEENRLSSKLDPSAELPLPDSVREAVNRRLSRLHASARQVLEAGAILGSQFEFMKVRSTAGRSEMETAVGLDELVSRQLLSRTEDNFHFSHDLVRKATAAAISPVRSRLLHNRAGRALEKTDVGSTAAIAYHFDEGGEWERALHYYYRSIDNAEALFAWQEVITLCIHVLELLERLDPKHVVSDYLQQRGKVLAKLILIHHNQGNLTARNECLNQFEALVKTSNSKSLELEYLLLSARHFHLDGHYPQALEVAQRGTALAGELNDLNAQCRLLAQTGLISFFMGQPDQALSNLETARALTDQNHDLELRANVLGRLAFVKSLFGKYQEALACQKEAYACHQRLGNHYFAAQYLIEIGDVYASLGLYAEASQSLNEILELARRTSSRYDEGHALLAMGGLHTCQGDYETAYHVYSEALDILSTLQRYNLTATAKIGLGSVLYHLGNYEKSLTWLEQGLARARSIQFPGRVARALIQMAMAEIAKENIDLARAHLEEGLATARKIHSVELIIAGLAVAAQIERRQGNLAGALAYADEALILTREIDLLVFEMWVRLEAGLTLLELNRVGDALEHTTLAARLIPRATQDWIRSEQVHLAHARTLRLSGELTAAEEQVLCSRTLHQVKAERILDPALRQQFSRAFEKELSSFT